MSRGSSTSAPAAAIRRVLTERTQQSIGDAARMAELMIASVERTPAPLRLVLGGDACTAMTAALRSRLDALVPQKDVAFSTDRPPA